MEIYTAFNDVFCYTKESNSIIIIVLTTKYGQSDKINDNALVYIKYITISN